MLLKNVYVEAEYITDSGQSFWIAQSKNLFGLNIQADTYEELCEAITQNVQFLIKENGIATSNTGVTIHLSVKASKIKLTRKKKAA